MAPAPASLAPTGYRVIDRRGQNRAGAYSQRLFATPSNTGQSQYYRPRPYTLDDFSRNLDVYTWAELVSYSRQLYAQLGNLGGAILQKNLYAVGDAWKPQFKGRNTAWGEQAEEWLTHVWYPVADVRGTPFDFTTNLFLDGISMDVDGDAAMLLTRAESGFPMVQFFPAHRIGSRQADGEIKGGAYDGAKIVNGCVKNRAGRVIAYRVLGDKKEEDLDVPAANLQLLYEPEWQSQDRGIPRIARTLLDWFDLQDIDVFLKRGVKLEQSVGLLHYNQEGEAPSASDIIVPREEGTPNQDVKIERREGGEIMYFRAGLGEKIESFMAQRPHPNTEAFISRLERRGLLAVGWFFELLDPSRIGGAAVRLIQDQARHSVAARKKTIRKRAYRAVVYALARAMKDRFLPDNPEPNLDWARWDFTTPAQLTVDEGYSRAADIDDLDRGLTTKADVAGKYGRWWEDVDAQRDREVRSLLTRATALMEEFNIDLDAALNLLEKRSPNPPPIGKNEPPPAPDRNPSEP